MGVRRKEQSLKVHCQMSPSKYRGRKERKGIVEEEVREGGMEQAQVRTHKQNKQKMHGIAIMPQQKGLCLPHTRSLEGRRE